ncbi:hypothetical protein MPER_02828, partial [Moniliophthora perniciosa FA553]
MYKTLIGLQTPPLLPAKIGLPVFGNIFDIPAKHPWKVCVQWARDYNSDIVSLRIPGATLVVLNKLEDIQELFGKRSAFYSDRNFTSMKADRMMSSQNYGERFKCTHIFSLPHVAS